MAAPQQHQLQFNGTGSQYFGIWIANLFLTIITFGIYAPWAKVRKHQFFYGHTLLAGERFDYTGNPMAILRGRLAAIGVFLLLKVSEKINASLALVSFLAVALLTPWLVQRTMRFNAYNSRYRNLRLRFDGQLGEAFFIYFFLSLLTLISLGLLAPYWMYRHKRYLYDNLGYGDHRFRFLAKPGDFYLIYLESLLLALFVVVLMATLTYFLFSGILPLLSHLKAGSKPDPAVLAALAPVFFMIPLLFMLLYFVLVVYTRTKLTNLCWSYTRLGNNRFRSQMRARNVAMIYFSNQLLTMFTLGLYTPWAQVRLIKYRLQSTSLIMVDDMENFFASAQGDVSAAGEEMADFLGVDISL